MGWGMSAEIESWGVCEECGSEDGTPGFVNYGCDGNPDCSGCDRCDFPCISCNREGRVR
jgi:hypothetical protein